MSKGSHITYNDNLVTPPPPFRRMREGNVLLVSACLEGEGAPHRPQHTAGSTQGPPIHTVEAPYMDLVFTVGHHTVGLHAETPLQHTVGHHTMDTRTLFMGSIQEYPPPPPPQPPHPHPPHPLPELTSSVLALPCTLRLLLSRRRTVLLI